MSETKTPPALPGTNRRQRWIDRFDRNPEYRTWQRILERCDPDRAKPRDAIRYASRGIRVCDRWRVFANFLADMGKRPSPDHSIDRIDNDGNYEPSNCRWATREVQRRNRADVVMVTIGGETAPLLEWIRRHGLNRSTVYSRVRDGWDPVRALTEPVRKVMEVAR